MGLSAVSSSKSRLLTCLIGDKALLCTQCRGIGPHLSARGNFMISLDLHREPGVHSRVTAGVAINNFCFFSDVWTPLELRCTPHDCKLGLAERYGHFFR